MLKWTLIKFDDRLFYSLTQVMSGNVGAIPKRTQLSSNDIHQVGMPHFRTSC